VGDGQASVPHPARLTNKNKRLCNKREDDTMNRAWRVALLASAATAAAMTAAAASAQVATAATDPGAVDAIVVTGTRLQASGFTAPTPVTVVGAAMIENRGRLNIADALNEIPSFQNSSGPSQGTRNYTGTLGFSTVDLRGLGAARTLVLVDGRRHVPIAPAGVVDVSVIPTNLVQRVETVTGGASAQYGSDAVAGVVNFILRDRLEGIRATAQAGTSQHGGNQEWAFNLAAGHGFAGGRLHLVAGLDYSKNLGISSQYKRDWGRMEPGFVGLPATRPAGVPANVLGYGQRFSSMTYGGIVISGPLKGTAFAPGGVPYQFNYGPLTGGSLMLGGDNYGLSESAPRHLAHPLERMTSMARLNFDLTPTTTLYVEGGYAHGTLDTQGAYGRSPDNIVIAINNPYLPAATRTAMQAAGVTTINMGRLAGEYGPGTAVTTNDVQRLVLGAKGAVFGNWKWDISGQTGRTLTRIDYYNFISTRFYQAANAIPGPNGTPICGPIQTNPYYLTKDATRRQQILNTIDQANCAPFNVFGTGSPSPEALAYVRSHFNQRILTVQNVVAASVSGSPFETWAGPVSFAFGGEARRDGGKQDADVFGINGANDGNNMTPLNGSQKVYEFFGETGIPLLKDSSFGQALDFNAAVRQTHYEYSGWVTTWKIGGTYEPTSWLRLRATQSRDIRAPRITELFQQGAANGLQITNPTNGVSASIPVINSGNPNLKPEVASTFTGGFVITPKWGVLNGLRLSMDYYHIDVKGVIGTVSGTDIINRYFNLGQTQYGPLIQFDSSPIGFNRINNQIRNLNQLLADGVDMEISYLTPIDRLGVPGRLNVSALITWANRLATIDQIGPTTVVTNRVGVAQGGGGPVSRWRANVTFDYSLGRFGSTLQARSFSGFLINPTLVGPDNPRYNPAAQNSVNDNKSPGLTYWSLSARYDIIQKGGRTLQVFGVVNNLLDKNPPISGLPMSANGGIPYDFIGRDFKIGVRMTM
jgi:outer membrane receptor protein involved in Fe transport